MNPLLRLTSPTVAGIMLGSRLGQAIAAESPTPDKSAYDLFHPTPRQFMREMSTDRPDKTESPYTVDGGHFQFEMDLATIGYDWSGPDTAAWAVAPVNLKLGLLNTVDLQVGLEPFNQVRVTHPATGLRKTRSGFGDVTTRLKVNLWGNDGGRTALAMMPFAVFPSGRESIGGGSSGGGMILPLAVELSRGWSMVVMTEADFLRDDVGPDYHVTFVNSVTLGHALVGPLSGYVEFFSDVGTERGARWLGTVDLGLTYKLTDNIQLDAGINIGVTESADDINPFVGFSWRF
ncbi:MAG: transporter [Pedosphaera sp.]|nr:transporter [Pedosphaera sp.]